MIVKFMGIGDLICALLILLVHFNLGFIQFPLIVTLYLIGKNIFFYKSLMSYIDGFIGLYIWVVFFYPNILDYVAVLYLIQKGLASLF